MESTTTKPISYTPSKEVQEFVESDYISLEDNISKALEFLPGREKPVNTEFKGNTIAKMQFIVIDLERKDLQRKEKKLTLPKGAARAVIDQFIKGKTIMQITRLNDKQGIRYEVKAVN